MEPVNFLIERVKEFAKLSQGFVNGAIRKCSISSNHDPIEILKRLQRESFSDIMKLRDRQEKAERILLSYKLNKGGPFQDTSTHMKGIVDVVGALLFVENDDHSACNAFDRVGIRTGIDLRFIFKTALRQKDQLVAQFAASQSSNHGLQGNPLTLEKLMYMANINDSLSLVTSPLGAGCNEYSVASNLGESRRLGRASTFVPPLFSEHHNCGAGVMYTGSSLAASVAELVSGTGMHSDDASRSLSTFGQITYQPFEEAKLTFSFLWKKCRQVSYLSKFGMLAIPVGHLKRRKSADVKAQASSSDTSGKAGGISSESIAVMLESELETTNLSGWIELQKSGSSVLQWGISLCDTPDDELGWGLRTGGKIEGNFNQLQLEGFFNFNFGNKFSLQPGLVYVTDGRNRTPAVVIRSNWLM